MAGLVLSLFMTPVLAGAQNKGNLCSGANFNFNGQACNPPDPKKSAQSKVNRLIEAIVNILSIIVGIVAVVMIIIGGFRYTTSSGDSAKVTSARNTILYALVGLIIAVSAQLIVKLVLKRLAG